MEPIGFLKRNGKIDLSNNVFGSLTAEELEEASSIASKFMKEFVGRPLDLAAATNVVMLEFITRHTHFSVDDVMVAVKVLSDFNTDRGEVGSILTSKITKDIN